MTGGAWAAGLLQAHRVRASCAALLQCQSSRLRLSCSRDLPRAHDIAHPCEILHHFRVPSPVESHLRHSRTSSYQSSGVSRSSVDHAAPESSEVPYLALHVYVLTVGLAQCGTYGYPQDIGLPRARHSLRVVFLQQLPNRFVRLQAARLIPQPVRERFVAPLAVCLHRVEGAHRSLVQHGLVRLDECGVQSSPHWASLCRLEVGVQLIEFRFGEFVQSHCSSRCVRLRRG